MHLERYEFEVLGNRYDFYSEGPKGRIKKAVIYQIQKKGHAPLYNLTFGDWNEDLNRIDDRAMSNNGDRQKILATVAASIVHFMERNIDAHIFAAGITPSRNRLYQININSYLAIISADFRIEGFIYNKWETFRMGRNYRAFLLSHRKDLNL